MTLCELMQLRKKHKIELIDIAAHTGLPVDYIRQIEGGQVHALKHDVERIRRAIRQIIQAIAEEERNKTEF